MTRCGGEVQATNRHGPTRGTPLERRVGQCSTPQFPHPARLRRRAEHRDRVPLCEDGSGPARPRCRAGPPRCGRHRHRGVGINPAGDGGDDDHPHRDGGGQCRPRGRWLRHELRAPRRQCHRLDRLVGRRHGETHRGMLKEVVPGMLRVAVLRNPASPDRETLWSETTAAARALGVQLQAMGVDQPRVTWRACSRRWSEGEPPASS